LHSQQLIQQLARFFLGFRVFQQTVAGQSRQSKQSNSLRILLPGHSRKRTQIPGRSLNELRRDQSSRSEMREGSYLQHTAIQSVEWIVPGEVTESAPLKEIGECLLN
jgi:hypothetical protein